MWSDAGVNSVDVAIVGAGAAGLATAILAARRLPGRSIVALDSAKKLGAKILVAGGGRCNVTNRVVTSADFNTGNPHILKRILAAFPVAEVIAFFREIGVELHEEEDGKLFPNTNKARTVLNALLGEAARRGVRLLTECRVTAVARDADGFRLQTVAGECHARCVVLATGGLSLLKTGSGGAGYGLAQHLGHSLIPTTPALVPLVLDAGFRVGLSGVSQDVELIVRAAGRKPVHRRGALLWTHFGASGPVVLDVSRHWHRAQVEQRAVAISANFLPNADFAVADQKLRELTSLQPRTSLGRALSAWLPARVAEALMRHIGLDGQVALAHVPREARRKLAHTLVEWPLPVRGSRGYGYAEVTAGGVPLDEVEPGSLASRCCPGLFLVGEILDVDGRIGGFNFQWAWSSAWVAAAGLARHLSV
jgi:predicted Rossmann fold flavoprotein